MISAAFRAEMRENASRPAARFAPVYDFEPTRETLFRALVDDACRRTGLTLDADREGAYLIRSNNAEMAASLYVRDE